MHYNKYLKLENELLDIAWENHFKIEVLKGYCESRLEQQVSSAIVFAFLTDICDNSLKLINKFDKF